MITPRCKRYSRRPRAYGSATPEKSLAMGVLQGGYAYTNHYQKAHEALVEQQLVALKPRPPPSTFCRVEFVAICNITTSQT